MLYQVRTFVNTTAEGDTDYQANKWFEKWTGETSEIEPISVARGDYANDHYLTILFRVVKK